MRRKAFPPQGITVLGLGALCLLITLACAGLADPQAGIGKTELDALQERVTADGWSTRYCSKDAYKIYCAVHKGDVGAVLTVAGPDSDELVGTDYVQATDGALNRYVKVCDYAKSEALRDRLVPSGAKVADLDKDKIRTALLADGWTLGEWQTNDGLALTMGWVDGKKDGLLVNVALTSQPGVKRGVVGVERQRHTLAVQVDQEGASLDVAVIDPQQAQELMALFED